MVWLRDSVRPALSTQDTCCDVSRVVRQRSAQCERLELYELRHARAMPSIERGLASHFVANRLGLTEGRAFIQRLYGHASERGLRDQIRLVFGLWGADEEQVRRDVPVNGGVS